MPVTAARKRECSFLFAFLFFRGAPLQRDSERGASATTSHHNGAGPSERVKRTDVHLHLPRAFSFDWCSVSEATIGRCLRRVSRCQTAFWRFRFDFGRGLAAFSVAGDAQIVHLRGPDFRTGFRSPFQDRPSSFLVGGPKTGTARWSLFWDRICSKKSVQLFAFRWPRVLPKLVEHGLHYGSIPAGDATCAVAQLEQSPTCRFWSSVCSCSSPERSCGRCSEHSKRLCVRECRLAAGSPSVWAKQACLGGVCFGSSKTFGGTRGSSSPRQQASSLCTRLVQEFGLERFSFCLRHSRVG